MHYHFHWNYVFCKTAFPIFRLLFFVVVCLYLITIYEIQIIQQNDDIFPISWTFVWLLHFCDFPTFHVNENHPFSVYPSIAITGSWPLNIISDWNNSHNNFNSSSSTSYWYGFKKIHISYIAHKHVDNMWQIQRCIQLWYL